VEKMPGFLPPRQWVADSDKLVAQREALAGEILFKEGLAMCKKAATRNFMSAMFGVQTGGKAPSSQSKPISSIPEAITAKVQKETQPQKKQATLFSYLKEVALIEDQMLANSMRQAKTKTKAAKAAKEAKEKSDVK
jgi:hypothetical protein